MANRSRAGLNPLFNLLASSFLVLSCLCMCAVAVVFALPNEMIPANLRPPDFPTEVTELDLTFPPTPTITDTPGPQVATFPPTWTSAPPTISPTRPTSTITPSPEDTLAGDTRTPTNTSTLTLTPTRTFTPGPPTKTRSALPYTQQGTPTYLSNYINTAGCNYMGIIGQAFNLDGKAELNLYVHLEGNGLVVDGITGSEPSIGPGAYKINLGSSPVTTTDIYKLQLRNSSGQPLSDVYTINTFGDCKKNLILVNFEQNHR